MVNVMILYHGSNLKIETPKLIPSKRLLDFGSGFYLTSNFEQAAKWAKRTTLNRECGSSIVSAFDIDKKSMENLNCLIFDSPNCAWLNFVSANRRGSILNKTYDLIIGPVANDQAIRTINNYLKGYLTEDMAIKLLLPQKLKDQYAFRTDRALSMLNFREGITVE